MLSACALQSLEQRRTPSACACLRAAKHSHGGPLKVSTKSTQRVARPDKGPNVRREVAKRTSCSSQKRVFVLHGVTGLLEGPGLNFKTLVGIAGLLKGQNITSAQRRQRVWMKVVVPPEDTTHAM
jgi:hypothetical protein